MRITFLSPPPNMSGGERVVAIYTRELIRMGHDVEIVCSQPRTYSAIAKIKSVVRGRGIPGRKSGMNSHYCNYDVPFRVVDHQGDLTAADVPDADVLIPTFWTTAHWAATMPPQKGARVYFLQDYGIPGQTWEQIQPTLSICPHIITLCDWLAEETRRRCDSSQISIVRNAVDLDHFVMGDVQRIPNRFGMVYRSAPSKGCKDAFLALAKAAEQTSIELLTFGQQPSRAERELFDNVQVLGRVPESELPEVYGSCRGWIFPSRLEGFGLPILEAMACHTPVIGTTAGAGRDLISQGGGILVPVADIDATADAIVRMSTMDDAAWKKLSSVAYQTASGYSWQDAATRFESVLLAAAV
ncbi:glycosyltransferase family 4 protein [Stieleria sp. TO1_6]|uniref:glycosyltransferase family 4 protein n=1 Tax=Stieleria tagensis TaxID=2956795 RepID=UPI0028C13211|nr:glycosyltransferase family 4 protein [Stieleria tagensis]MCO8120677.1 glycosyltransferase family 4 protein [Stieleria tagensis]